MPLLLDYLFHVGPRFYDFKTGRLVDIARRIRLAGKQRHIARADVL